MLVTVNKSNWQLVKIIFPRGSGKGIGSFNISANDLDEGFEFIPSQFADGTKLGWSVDASENRNAPHRLD